MNDVRRGAPQMGQALLLRHAFQFRRVVTPAPVTDHDAAEIAGEQFPDLITMLWAYDRPKATG